MVSIVYGAENPRRVITEYKHKPYDSNLLSNLLIEEDKKPVEYKDLMNKEKEREQKRLEDLKKLVIADCYFDRLVLLQNIRRSIREATNECNNVYIIGAISALQRKEPYIFSKAMKDNFGTKILADFLKKFQFEEKLKGLSVSAKGQFLSMLAQNCSPKNLAAIDPETGQNIVHQSTPFHWLDDYFYTLAKIVVLDIPTQKPDQHPEATVFHSVALQIRNNDEKAKYGETKDLYKIDNAIKFLIHFFNNGYSHVIPRKSQKYADAPDFSDIACWDLLPLKIQYKIYNQLNFGAILGIHNEIQRLVLLQKLTPPEALKMSLNFPIKC